MLWQSCWWELVGAAPDNPKRHRHSLCLILWLLQSLCPFFQWSLNLRCRELSCRCTCWGWAPQRCIFMGCNFCNGFLLIQRQAFLMMHEDYSIFGSNDKCLDYGWGLGLCWFSNVTVVDSPPRAMMTSLALGSCLGFQHHAWFPSALNGAQVQLERWWLPSRYVSLTYVKLLMPCLLTVGVPRCHICVRLLVAFLLWKLSWRLLLPGIWSLVGRLSNQFWPRSSELCFWSAWCL